MKSLTAIQKFILKYEKKGFKVTQRRRLKHGRRIYLYKEESGFLFSTEYGIYVYHVIGDCSADTLRECFRDYVRFYENHEFDEHDKGFFVCSDDVDSKLFRDIRKAVIDDADIRRSIKLQKVKATSQKPVSRTVRKVRPSKKTTPPLTSEQTERLIHSVGTRCSYPNCKETVSLDIHHIIPRQEGGSNRRSNLVVLCPTHHRLADRGAIPKRRLKMYSVSKMEMGRKAT
jgi:5-methylcytosine-specific restriction endonuclease McrA